MKLLAAFCVTTLVAFLGACISVLASRLERAHLTIQQQRAELTQEGRASRHLQGQLDRTVGTAIEALAQRDRVAGELDHARFTVARLNAENTALGQALQLFVLRYGHRPVDPVAPSAQREHPQSFTRADLLRELGWPKRRP